MSSYNLTILCVDFGILSVWIFSAWYIQTIISEKEKIVNLSYLTRG